MDSGGLPTAYRLEQGTPTTDAYLRLREQAGLSPRRVDQARRALAGSWAAVHVVFEIDEEAVGMGRVLGDGGWCFHVVDMAVMPQHQRKGIGDAILSTLLDQIRLAAPPGAFVNLLADRAGRRLYARHGFEPTAPQSVGMALTLG